MNVIIDNVEGFSQGNCIIANVSILYSEVLRFPVFKGSNLCLDRLLLDDESQPYFLNNIRLFSNEIHHTDTIWTSFAVHYNVKKVYIFTAPNGSLPIFKHIGMSHPLIKELYYQDSNSFMSKITEGMKNIVISPKNDYNRYSYAVIKFNEKRGKLIKTDINLVGCCLGNISDETDKHRFKAEWLTRKIFTILSKRNLTRKEDVIVLTVWYETKNNKMIIHKSHFGLCEEILTNEILDEIETQKISFV